MRNRLLKAVVVVEAVHLEAEALEEQDRDEDDLSELDGLHEF
jgi:hypothetical protein